MVLIGHAVSKKRFENNAHVNVYNPGAGADNPMGHIYFKNINLLSILSFAASFPIYDFVTDFPHLNA